MPNTADEGEDELIARIARQLRQPVRTDPALDRRVMAVVESLPRHRPAGTVVTAVRWLTRRRSLALSPLGGLALAAGIAAVGFVAASRGSGRSPAIPAGEAARATPASTGLLLVDRSGRSVVQFVLFAPEAKSVALVGDFNDWDPDATPLLTAQTGGAWSVTVPLTPGRHRYAFVVDGTRWIADPGAPPARDDDFGSPNSVVTVGA